MLKRLARQKHLVCSVNQVIAQRTLTEMTAMCRNGSNPAVQADLRQRKTTLKPRTRKKQGLVSERASQDASTTVASSPVKKRKYVRRKQLEVDSAVILSQIGLKKPRKARKAVMKHMEMSITGLVALQCSSAVDVKRRIIDAIGWQSTRPVGGGGCVKKITNKGIHTFIGMVGYCLKDHQEIHFQVCMKGISDAVRREGMQLFTFYGGNDTKNRVELNPNNIVTRTLQYNKYVCHHPLGTSFRGCLRRMLTGGHYALSTIWLINKGLDKTRIASMWKAYVQPGTLTMADIDKIFFWMPRAYPSRYIEGLHPCHQIMKTSAVNDEVNSNGSLPHPEQISRNLQAQLLPDWASFLLLLAGDNEPSFYSREENTLEAVGSNCCNLKCWTNEIHDVSSSSGPACNEVFLSQARTP
ncbi:hypothetical protein R1sor_021392 [Riccia sorocarpa]|uniref:Replitron HUH endonuclease domain-containing protein n=1 Tax=Riccia sorocarpa TaxID=122646 RepID=A0ABD3GIK8_9MARC